MAGTRRSTRQAASRVPVYAESASESKAPKHNAKQSTRRKRARTDDDVDVDVDGLKANVAPPAKKAARSEAKTSQRASKPSSNTPSQPTMTDVLSPLEPSSETNRDSSGAQEVYWLLKAEPLPRYENGVNVAFSIDDLRECKDPEPWSGVRNPLACKNMRTMRVGDLGFFYHSNAKPSGIAGVLRVVEEAKIDKTAFDEKDPYYDKKSVRGKERWFCVGVEFVRKFDEVLDLAWIKGKAGKGEPLEGMQLVTNSRLSVNRVSKGQWEYLMGVMDEKEGKGDKGKANNVD